MHIHNILAAGSRMKECNRRKKEAVVLDVLGVVALEKSRHLGDRIPMQATTEFEKCKSKEIQI